MSSEAVAVTVALVAIIGSFMVSYSTAKAEAMGVKPPRGSMRRAERSVYLYVASGVTSVWKVYFGDSASPLLHELPIIGLAKEHEEIYRPGRALPLQLPIDSGALRLLQRIRDEAHRFANTYHQLLMKKRIGESILDDCPGVSQNRKNLLLRKFGSVSRLRKASVEEIASTEGIGPKLAEEVHRFLQRH